MNTTTRAQRINARQDKIYEKCNSMKAPHTPGPWTEDRNHILDKDRCIIASIDYTQSGYVRGNAALCAAAPDLLEALKTIRCKDKKSLLADFAYAGPEGGKKHIEQMGKYYDGYNKCLQEIQDLIKPVIAQAEGN
jgi:hypothetical protein